MRMVITNKWTNTLESTSGLHPYWLVPNVLGAKIVGLSDDDPLAGLDVH
jgi:hypothetical protein